MRGQANAISDAYRSVLLRAAAAAAASACQIQSGCVERLHWRGCMSQCAAVTPIPWKTVRLRTVPLGWDGRGVQPFQLVLVCVQHPPVLSCI